MCNGGGHKPPGELGRLLERRRARIDEERAQLRLGRDRPRVDRTEDDAVPLAVRHVRKGNVPSWKPAGMLAFISPSSQVPIRIIAARPWKKFSCAAVKSVAWNPDRK